MRIISVTAVTTEGIEDTGATQYKCFEYLDGAYASVHEYTPHADRPELVIASMEVELEVAGQVIKFRSEDSKRLTAAFESQAWL